MTSRQLALQILNKYKPGKTNLSKSIQSVLNASAESRDKGLARRLVWEAARHLNTIDWIISRYSKKPDSTNPIMRNILRLGTVQLLYFQDEIPEYAGINESVNLVKHSKNEKYSGFVNAVLREINRDKKELFRTLGNDSLEKRLSIEYSYPEWMIKRWLKRFTEEEALELLKASNAAAGLTIRVNTSKISRENLLKELKEAGIDASPSQISQDGINLLSSTEIGKLESYRAGHFIVQDEASQLVSRVLEPEEGEVILDLCAGKGVKATHLAQLTKCKAKIIAVDNSLQQLETAKQNAELLSLNNIEFINEEAESLEGIIADKVLVDVPCSGTGTIRRRPDIKWNNSFVDITSRYPKMQKKILFSAAKHLKKGGVLVYSTCSIEPEENEGVVDSFLERFPKFILEGINVPELNTENAEYLHTYPHKNSLDGFFVARMRKT
jgi:16S rRNA (cytosine967-C5)-methyltransferase